MPCLKCGSENSADAKFCRACGNKLEGIEPVPTSGLVQCPKCGQSNEAGKKFCPKCGASLVAAVSAPTAPAPSYPSATPRPSASAPVVSSPATPGPANAPAADSPRPDNAAIQFPPPKEGMNKAVVGGVIAAVILATAGGGGYWYYQQQEAKKVIAAETEPNTEAQKAMTYSDPFAYCKAVFNVPLDAADRPPFIVASFLRANEGPLEWRCVDGKVMACYLGATGSACQRRDANGTPPSGLKEFCLENPNEQMLTRSQFGPDAPENWGCVDGRPMAKGIPPRLDRQSYVVDNWVDAQGIESLKVMEVE